MGSARFRILPFMALAAIAAGLPACDKPLIRGGAPCSEWDFYDYLCESDTLKQKEERKKFLEFGPCTEGDLINRTCK